MKVWRRTQLNISAPPFRGVLASSSARLGAIKDAMLSGIRLLR